MFEPQNEQSVIAVFSMQLERSAWKLIEIRSAFPDAVLEMDGIFWKVEFEFFASNFLNHRHDVRECDLIICWKNDYPDCPLPVIELIDPQWVNKKVIKGNPLLNELEYWRQKALIAEKRLESLRVRHQRMTTKDESLSDEIDIDKLLEFYSQNPKSSLRNTGKQFGISHTQVSKILKRLESEQRVHVNGSVQVL